MSEGAFGQPPDTVRQGPLGRRQAMKFPLGRITCREMIRVALTDAAYDAVASTLPKCAARRPVQRDRDQYFIQVEAAEVDQIRPYVLVRPRPETADAARLTRTGSRRKL